MSVCARLVCACMHACIVLFAYRLLICAFKTVKGQSFPSPAAFELKFSVAAPRFLFKVTSVYVMRVQLIQGPVDNTFLFQSPFSKPPDRLLTCVFLKGYKLRHSWISALGPILVFHIIFPAYFLSFLENSIFISISIFGHFG